MECGGCMAWYRMENQPEWGECRRNAPSPRTGPDSSAVYGPFNFRGIWPYTRAVDFCHEYLEPMPMPEMDGTMEEPSFPVPQEANPDVMDRLSFRQVVEEAERIAGGTDAE